MDIMEFLLVGNVLLAVILIVLLIVLIMRPVRKGSRHDVKGNLQNIKDQIEDKKKVSK